MPPRIVNQVKQWLSTLGLENYTKCFVGYINMQEMLDLSEADIKQLGVTNGADRAVIVSSLDAIRSGKKQEDSLKEKDAINSQRDQTAAKDLNAQVSAEEQQDQLTFQQDARKALEFELGLDSRDLRSHAWYHGTILRQRAEDLVLTDGQFLIRDCISQPGDFVLTCRWNGNCLHFVISKKIFQPDTVYERIQYQLEDDSYDTIQNLVTSYVGGAKVVSTNSKAKISSPVNRTMPLSFYADKYGLQCQINYGMLQQKLVEEAHTAVKPLLSPLHCERLNSVPGAPTHHRSSSFMSQPGSCDHDQYRPGSSASFSSAKLTRVGSESILSPTMERERFDFNRPLSSNIGYNASTPVTDEPPPKPIRTPGVKIQGTFDMPLEPDYDNASPPNERSNCDSGNGSADSMRGDSARPRLSPKAHSQRLGSETRSSLIDRQTVYFDAEDFECEDVEDSLFLFSELNPPSCFDVVGFTSPLISADNKPLDVAALVKIKSVILDTGSKIVAAHLTKIDLEVLKYDLDGEGMLGVTSGIELLTLPHGRQLALDLIERSNCLKVLVAITILTCSNDEERADLINQWIQIALDTKTALGNLYGFSTIMLGLGLNQIQRLKPSWNALRQAHTQSALTYETKLKPVLKAMNDCSNPQAPNTTIPYLLPLVSLLAKSDLTPKPLMENDGEDVQEDTSYLDWVTLPYENPGNNYETSLKWLSNNLENGRVLIESVPIYKRNSSIVMDGVKFDSLFLDVFKTEFHLRFLWGCKGAIVGAEERFEKFEKVLNVMAERCEKNLS